MQLTATLIAPGGGLSRRRLDEIRDRLSDVAGTDPGAPAWLADGTAADVPLGDGELAIVRTACREAFAEAEIDIVVQPQADRRKTLLLADMDSTIVTSETLDELAAFAGLKEKVAAITARAMRGEIDFKGALRERVAMLEGLSTDALEKTLAGIELTPGARTLVQTMRANGAYTVLVSGGFRFFTARIAERCGFHEDRANDLLIADGALTGKVGEPILDRDAKLATLREVTAARNIGTADSMATGDGANDLPMIEAAGLGVAFRAKPAVEAAAPAAVRYGDLTALLYIQGYRREDFVDG